MIARFKDGEFDKIVKHPRKDEDTSKITGLAEGVTYHEIETLDRPEIDNNFEYLNRVESLIGDVYTISWEVVEKSKEDVCNALTSNLQSYIDTCIPQRKQIDYIAYASDVVDKKAEGTVTEEELQKFGYLKLIQEWQMRISAKRDKMVDDYLNNDIKPTFDNWEEMP